MALSLSSACIMSLFISKIFCDSPLSTVQSYSNLFPNAPQLTFSLSFCLPGSSHTGCNSASCSLLPNSCHLLSCNTTSAAPEHCLSHHVKHTHPCFGISSDVLPSSLTSPSHKCPHRKFFLVSLTAFSGLHVTVKRIASNRSYFYSRILTFSTRVSALARTLSYLSSYTPQCLAMCPHRLSVQEPFCVNKYKNIITIHIYCFQNSVFQALE